MKKSEFAALMASERCLPGIEDTAPLCTRQFEPGGCVECWTEFLSALEDDIISVCTWTEDENGVWDTACGERWELIEGRPHENSVVYCHRCGRSRGEG